MRLGRFLSLALLFLACFPAGAKELYGPEAGVVPFGMGRAYSAIADDWLSLYYNPAGLAMVKKVDFQLFDIHLATNNDVLGSYSTLGAAGKASSGSVATALNGFTGKHLMIWAGENSQITFPHFALGVLYDIHADFDMQNTANNQTNMRYTKDFGFLGGGAVSSGKDNTFRFGTTLKYIKRTGGEQFIPISALAGNKQSITDKFTSSGWGIGADLGMQFKWPSKSKTEITNSFVWHDIGNTTFGGSQQQDQPTRIDQNITAGLGIRFPIQGKQNRRKERRYGSTRSSSALSFAFDYSHANIPWHVEQVGKHLHAGINLDIPILSFQVGINQSALTLGTSFDIGIVRVSAATWGEELGSYTGQRVDRRWLLSIGSVLGFGSL